MAAIGITFGMAKESLAEVVDNGVCSDDPRVMRRTNSAIKLLLDLGMWVNTMVTYDVTATGNELFLPKEMENAIEVEVQSAALVRNQSDVREGHYDLVNSFAYVDPSYAHDNPLDDLFLHPDPMEIGVLRRKYNYPGLQSNAVVRVTGKKRYVPIVADDDTLIIQNVEAIRSAILYLEHKYRGAGSIDDAGKYLADAKFILESEVKQHLLDPRKSLKRKANYQSDLITYAEKTLGRTRARIALELAGFLLRGKAEVTYLVNRAVQMLVDSRNQLAIAGRISVHGTVTEISYAPANTPETVLPWGDFNQIRLLIQSFVTEGPDPANVAASAEYRKQAFELQRNQLVEATELARHNAYTTDLSTYNSGTLGWMVARLALELPTGLAMTQAELARCCSMSEMRIMEASIYKGTLKTLSATITGGEILFPRDVEAILAASICGDTISDTGVQFTDIRSIYFEYQKNGPGHSFACESRFVDMGEVYFPQTGSKRRKYLYRGPCDSNVEANFVAKVRWIQKELCDEMVIKNFEAIKLFCQSLSLEKSEKWDEAQAAREEAFEILEREMNEYLGGLSHTQNVDTSGFGYAGLGVPL